MSKEALAKVVQRSISDAAFRRQLATDPTGALRGYDLTGDETAALRSGDPGRLTAFGVEQRMSKAFTLGGDGALGTSVNSSMTSDLSPMSSGALTAAGGAAVNAAVTGGAGANADAVIPSDPARPETVITGGSEPRDTAPAWIGEYNPNAAVVSSPDAADRNLALSSTDETAGAGVQSPDAADRNFVQTGGSVEPRDVAPAWIGEYSESTGAVQSPDAADRNLIQTSGSVEPRDVAPTWIGENQSLSSVMSDVSPASANELTDGGTDDGFLPTVNYADDATDVSSATDSHEGGDLQQ